MKTYYIKNVDCENCARKIESQIKRKTNAEQVTINLMSNKLIISGAETDEKELTSIANQVEDGVKIYSQNDEEEEIEATRGQLIVLGIGFLLFLGALITSFRGLYLVGYAIVGYPVIKLAIKNMLQRQFFDEYFLMTIATLAAIGINQWSEALAVMLFYSIGEYIQGRSLDKTKMSITELALLNVRNANVVTASGIKLVATEDLAVGDIIRVASGERIAVDSKLLSKEAQIDTSHISGESEPQEAIVNDLVYGGSVNSGDQIDLEVIARADDSMIAKLIELVTYADSQKTKTEKFITRFSRIYTPIVVALAAIIVLIFPIVWDISYEEAIYRAVTLLVISCPCAFVLSVPLGYVVLLDNWLKSTC